MQKNENTSTYAINFQKEAKVIDHLYSMFTTLSQETIYMII
jgi:hypothetical protein